jgi:transposase InsO family protein
MSKPLKTADEVAAERFNLIAPLIGDGLDKGRRYDLTHEIAARGGLSERTVRRYAKAWEEGGFESLKPKRGWERPDSKLGDGFGAVVDSAVELRRESPSRSVADIIKILELEGAVEPGAVARSTLQRHLAARGYSSSQMKMYASKGAAARRFQKDHRNQLWQVDIKYGPYVPAEGGRKKQIYLVAWIDDATRYVTCARFYADQTVGAVEDSLYRAIQKYGVPDKVFCDNGRQFRSKWMSEACAKLGIRLLTARPYRPEGKGKVENFNKQMDKFISEAAFKKPAGVAEYNELLDVWLDGYYHKNPHSGLGGITPAAAFGTDARPLRFAPAETLRDAFLHSESRKVDKTGCVSFNGHLYEAGLAYVGCKVEIRFDPTWTEEIEVVHGGAEPFAAKKLAIGANCGAGRGLPERMKNEPPKTSRLLDGLEKERARNRPAPETATAFKDFWKGGE